jgi:hypothetical protein
MVKLPIGTYSKPGCTPTKKHSPITPEHNEAIFIMTENKLWIWEDNKNGNFCMSILSMSINQAI